MRRNKKVQEEVSEGAPEWMTTYSDLVTLLLTFFILLFSMASLDIQKFEEIAVSLRSSFLKISDGDRFDFKKGKDVISIREYNNSVVIMQDPQKSENEKNKEKDKDKDKDKDKALLNRTEDQKNLQSVKEDVEKTISELGLTDNVKVIEDQEQIILRLDSIILFDSGRAEVKTSGIKVLQKIGTMLQKLNNEIFVQGHTDNLPIKSGLFPSNWELSTKRATNVVVFFINECKISPNKLTATGNGEFKPIVSNDSESNRQKNRRIDIVIKK